MNTCEACLSLAVHEKFDFLQKHSCTENRDLRGALECGDRAERGNKGGSSELHGVSVVVKSKKYECKLVTLTQQKGSSRDIFVRQCFWL
jgi:hypothetical protein